MFSSKSIDSSVFQRLTGKSKPKLAHPTAVAFDPLAWQAILKQPNIDPRDETLATAAILLGANLSLLRAKYIDKAFQQLSGEEIARFALADANRSWAILREKGRNNLTVGDGSVAYPSVIGNVTIDVGPLTRASGVDDLNTTVVDCVPHWLFRAVSAPAIPTVSTFDYHKAGAFAQGTLSLEHALKEVWQEILWEGWIISLEDTGVVVLPKSLTDQGLWRAWEWREQALISQHAILNRHDERALPDHLLQRVLDRTAISVEWNNHTYDIALGHPSAKVAEAHRSAIDILESSYLEPFLDMPLAGGTGLVTVRHLECAICVIRDIAELMFPTEIDVEYRTKADIDRLSCALRCQHAIDVLTETLELNPTVAKECIDRITSRPFANIGPLFRNGLWHKPLVASRDGNTIHLILGALIWGSPTLRAERWLQEGAREDLSKTPLGLKYEAHTRKRLSDALSKNILLASVSVPAASVSPGQAHEEIDGLIRIGSTVLVLEMKCFLAPHEPGERYNYIVKLENAAAQASRKARWLLEHQAEIRSRVGPGPSGSPLRIIPLVVVNQSYGTGCKFDDCVVIDAHFLHLYLSGGMYHSDGAMDLGKPGQTAYRQKHLYTSADEAAARIPDIFIEHPGLKIFSEIVDWKVAPIPLADGVNILMAAAHMDVEKYMSRMPSNIHAAALPLAAEDSK